MELYNKKSTAIEGCTGLLVVIWTDNSSSLGTGVLISPTYVLTCAHNIVESKEEKLTGVVAKSVLFYPGYFPLKQIKQLKEIPNNTPSFAVKWCFYHEGYQKNTRSFDVAVLKLEAPCETVDDFPVLLAKNALAKKAPENVSLFSEPLKIPMKILGYRFNDNIVVSEINTDLNLLVYNAETNPGVSGSPIYIDNVICGIHTSRSRYGFGVGLFDEILSFILGAMRVKGGFEKDAFVIAID